MTEQKQPKEKLSLHRALAELKLVDKKLGKKIQGCRPLGVKREGKLVDDIYKEEVFDETAKSLHQSIEDLVKRKTKLKVSIVKANSETEVIIGKKKMTIADAITYKDVIQYRKAYLERLEGDRQTTLAQLERANAKVEDNAIRIAEQALQKDNVKIGDNDVENVIGPYLKQNKYHLVDPLKIEELIKDMTEEIENFETEVDAVLSEANATTFIEI